MIQKITKNKYENWHAMIEIYNFVPFMIKLLVIEKSLKIMLDYGLEDNGKIFNIDLFQTKMIELIWGIVA